MASRIGVLETLSRAARSFSTTRAPGGISSSTIMSRIARYAARLNVDTDRFRYSTVITSTTFPPGNPQPEGPRGATLGLARPQWPVTQRYGGSLAQRRYLNIRCTWCEACQPLSIWNMLFEIWAVPPPRGEGW